MFGDEPIARFTGGELYRLVEELYPICRSITGDGVRQTLARVSEVVPLKITEVPSGTTVFDWEVPREWNIRDAWVKDATGRRVVDFREHNLHVVNYSVPVEQTMSLDELRPRLHSLPDHPDWIPYRTSYYNEDWGFCLRHRDLEKLADGDYQVCIDSSLEDGALTLGEFVVPGRVSDEVLFYTHVCHPSLCNDNLAGIAVVSALAAALAEAKPRLTYRFVFGPGTIGSITWLAGNEGRLDRIRTGLVAVLLGDDGKFTYKQTRRGDAPLDRVVPHVLTARGIDHQIEAFSPYGYDERQFASPGINLDVARLTRSANGTYPEYHTSADNLDFVKAENLRESLQVLWDIIEVLDGDRLMVSTNQHCEPQLGRRGLYGSVGGRRVGHWEMAMLWVLNLADGSHSLFDMTERSGLSFAEITAAAEDLADKGLLTEQAGRPRAVQRKVEQ